MVTADVIAAAVAAVRDPEIKALTIEDLGVLRDVEVDQDGHVTVTITPTYSGCPAMDVIREDILVALRRTGVEDAEVHTALSPAWTTDWMSEDAKRKLTESGIAPPGPARRSDPIPLSLSVRCTHCGSPDTEQLARFGSTACKALWRCRACAEPFDHFKAH